MILSNLFGKLRLAGDSRSPQTEAKDEQGWKYDQRETSNQLFVGASGGIEKPASGPWMYRSPLEKVH